MSKGQTKKTREAAGNRRKLTRAEKKQIAAVIRQAKGDGKAHTAQQTIPYLAMYPDGICKVAQRKYSKSIAFEDINYQLAQADDKTAIFENWCDFLNYFDASVNVQLSFINQGSQQEQAARAIHIPPQNDDFNSIRTEYSDMLKMQLAKGNNGLVKHKYITFSIEADNPAAARARLSRIETDVLNNFKVLGVSAHPLSGYERLKVLHGVFHPAGEPFSFSYDWLTPTGLTTKDFIAPSSFKFGEGRYFAMGKKTGAVSFLEILAPELNDRILADMLDLETGVIVNLHIKSIDQSEAIKTIKRKITDLDKMKIEEQKKAVRSGYDIDILPSDLATFGNEAKNLLQDLQSRNEQYKKWSYDSLPILPQEWKYTVSADKEKQFKTLKELMHRADVSEVVNACDAGREGELIFRFVYEMAGCKKPMRRLWISSMEDSAIKEGFSCLKNGRDYDPLFASALCRAKADWLIGINATRLFSVLYNHTLNVGRVQTPTLKMLVDRDAAITTFKKEKYYHVRLALSGAEAASERISNKAEADALKTTCEASRAVCTSLVKEKKTAAPPKLFDLTSLQREANRLFGYTAKQTLDLAQALYEKRLLTYPRTDSAFLTDDMGDTAAGIIKLLCGKFSFMAGKDFTPELGKVLNSKKVSDHHAIIPTMELAKTDLAALPESERNILTLSGARLLMATAAPHTFEAVTAVFECAGQSFTARGKTVLSDGWKEIDRRYRAALKNKPETDDADSDTEKTLPPFTEGQTFDNPAATVTEHDTTPPKPHNEASLLSAMERAGSEDTDPDAERKGLGTPATRAAVIEKLVKGGFVERKGKQLLPTKDGINLVCVLPDTLTSPQLTAEWENNLTQIAKGKADPAAFMEGIENMARELVKTYPFLSDDKAQMFKPEREALGSCPRCGSPVYEGKKNYYCSNKECIFTMWKNDRFFEERKVTFTPKIAAALLKSGKVNVKKLYSPKTGKTYNGTIVLADTGGRYVNYRIELPKKK